MIVHKAHATRRPGRPATGDKRRRILDAAVRAFAERGYHGTSVPDVAMAAEVSTGTLYYYFDHKERLVNEAYRDAKLRLRAAMLDGLPVPALDDPSDVQAWFLALWDRLAAFARREPDAFRFLEMQDHVPYLDAESRRLELSAVAPLFLTGKRIHDLAGGERVDLTIALLWGGFVGVVKAGRLGYIALDEASLHAAGVTMWRLLAPEVERAAVAAADTHRGAPSA